MSTELNTATLGRSNENPWNKIPAGVVSPSTSPWGKSAPVQPCSLEDVMSEQLATELQTKETNLVDEEQQLQDCLKMSEASAGSPSTTTANDESAKLSDAQLAAQLAAAEEEGVKSDPNDELIALLLQRQFDREHDAELSKVEQKYNGNSKVAISFDNYKRKHLMSEYCSNAEEAVDYEEEEEDDNYQDLPEYPSSTKWGNGTPTIGVKGYSGAGKNIVTKHDSVICGRRNAQRLMQFPPEFGCGDGEGMDMQLPNTVYNNLKRHSKMENKRGNKVVEKKDHSTAMKAVDEKTRILIYKMVNAEFLTGVDGVVSEGKEAVVFKANGGRKDEIELPKDVILKVYKTSMNEFKTRLKYVSGDYRLSKDSFKKFNPRKLMRVWAEKEYLNLKKLKRNGVLCPIPLALKKHVLAMSCIGGEKPAPKLRDVVLSPEDMQDAYQQTVELMKRMYHKCNMVHCDFSAYNLLWYDGKVWVIDVGQAVDRENASSSSFLLRDCKNIVGYFKQGGVYGVPTAEELFNDITSYCYKGEGKIFESQVKRYEKEEYAFDYFFELSESSRSQRLELGDTDISGGSSSSGSSSGEDEGDYNMSGGEERLHPSSHSDKDGGGDESAKKSDRLCGGSISSGISGSHGVKDHDDDDDVIDTTTRSRGGSTNCSNGGGGTIADGGCSISNDIDNKGCGENSDNDINVNPRNDEKNNSDDGKKPSAEKKNRIVVE